ncbi:hypothetical protein KIN20_004986 [Parelaphostrongylus tenuis]|uniref:Protein kish n=1 Tax=Parelaphostrongylus tenuis TaxID=148309 RepID=A0AAD5M2H9_PARTN|nr:hypothetical protein KIN20_004986 [Parelaphostrongylus tenuis]
MRPFRYGHRSICSLADTCEVRFLLLIDLLLREVALFFKLSALFNFQSLLSVLLLLICTCAYIRSFAPKLIDRNKEGLLGVFWKLARIGERLSPWVAASCFCMAFVVLFL